ncbi:hypothetical protein [Kocuria nitroreducens]|uniref:hypothetical protein n=1 Tax=Kocuria nitroreducens TaxID=3058914 RepID=UPI0036DF9E27
MSARRSARGWDRLAGPAGSAVVVLVVVQLLLRGVVSVAQLALGAAALVVVALVLGQRFVVPWLARRPPNRPRITTTRAWTCPMPPEEALERIRTAFEDLGPAVRSEECCVEVSAGSDVTFRRRGTASEFGWRALPLLATFRVAPGSGGSEVAADVRDDLGWYPDAPSRLVEDEIDRRSASLIERAICATCR